ncbi:Pvc16 family protein [Nitriliruptor alkaliphilus]|uniref:Pvc16 family protein n=1 Tax=Nitriliruptor alkaliphilus TaxID=427918 RepID=UPI0006987A38|nr:Pvc16 family protein [Nitriliruptor alkaliphilus]
MIEELDRALERWLRAAVPLPAGIAEIGFDPPERDWESRRSTPLVSIFLYAVAPSKEQSTGSRVVPRSGGGLAREATVRVLSARYQISVWGGGPSVEHDLLGRVMRLLAAHRAIPDEHLSDVLRAARPTPVVSLEPDESTTTTDLWNALSVAPRPAIQMLVEAPAGPPVAVPVNDPPTALVLATTDRTGTASRSLRRRTFGRTEPSAAGGRAIGRRGSAVIEDSGRFNVEADPGDSIVIEPPGTEQAT